MSTAGAVAGWHLGDVVAALRRSREAANRKWVYDLPSREELVRIVAGLRAALYPAHFGTPDLGDGSVDYFIGQTLDWALRALREQVRRALTFRDAPEVQSPDAANAIVAAFAARLPHVRTVLDDDVRAAFEGDPAATGLEEALLCYPGVTAITHHRLAHELHLLGVPLLPRMISEIAHAATGVDIHPGAEIGHSFFIDHGTAVVIGETTRIGDRVRLYQGVTLGAKSFPLDDKGLPVKGIPRHPIVEDDVVIYAGATILGRVTIGAGSSIGGNVWLTRSVPPGSRVTQAQVRSEAFEGGGGI